MNNQLEFGIYQQCREFLDFQKKHADVVSDQKMAEMFADEVASGIRNHRRRVLYPSKYDFKKDFATVKKIKNHGKS